MGNMAGVFVILLGAFVIMVGLRGTHTALFGNLFANTSSSAEAMVSATNHHIGSDIKPGIRGVFA